MRVEVDEGSGFCFGVVRAIRLAEEAVAQHGSVRSLGDIVHNRVEVERLAAMGLATVSHSGLQDMAGRTVLIRAHGEPPATYRMAERLGIEIVDATCPVVARLQRMVGDAFRTMRDAGGQVVILGKKGHAEVVGLTGQTDTVGCGDSGAGQEYNLGRAAEGTDGRSFCDAAGQAERRADGQNLCDVNVVQNDKAAGCLRSLGEADSGRKHNPGKVTEGGEEPDMNTGGIIVIEGVDDLDAIDFTRPVYLLSQTTQSLALFGRVGAEIMARAADPTQVTVHDTICRQVADRDPHLREFAAQHDVVVFVSGRKSSNGRALFEACSAANVRSHMVEDETELRGEWFEGAESVGVCGATSTPRWLMERVAQAVEQCGERVEK